VDIAAQIIAEVTIEIIGKTKLNLDYSSGDL
jgi:hypothetical protein